MKWEELDYETRLNVTEYIFKAITEEPSCSFRRLIYNRLGFEPDAYSPLYSAGGMMITNAIFDSGNEFEELKSSSEWKEKIIKLFKN